MRAKVVVLGYVIALSARFAVAEEAVETEPAAQSPAEQVNLHEIEQKLLKATNAARARHGLAALKMSPRLMKSARAHCSWMCRTGNFVHEGSVAENIAMGQRSVDEVINAWMNSPGHRANMLHGGYGRLGVSAYQLENGSIYWCQQFLGPKPDPSQATAQTVSYSQSGNDYYSDRRGLFNGRIFGRRR